MFNYRPKIKEICVAILSIFILQSCYSSTAVKGIPVRDLVIAQDERVVRRIMGKRDKEDIARLSEVKENKSFSTISGIPEYRVGSFDVLEIISHKGDTATSTFVTVDSRC